MDDIVIALVNWMVPADKERPCFATYGHEDGAVEEKYRLSDFLQTTAIKDPTFYQNSEKLGNKLRKRYRKVCKGYSDLFLIIINGIITVKYKPIVEESDEDEDGITRSASLEY